MTLEVAYEDVAVRIAGSTIVDGLSFVLRPGEVVGLVGPNGSGKSTALRCLYRALEPAEGVVRVGPDDLASLAPRDGARLVAAVTQGETPGLDFTVAELVALGRAPHRAAHGPGDPGGAAACRSALERLRLQHLADRGVLSLSGGERQRALIARALAQQPRVLVLDEPTNHLDIRHQLELLRLLRETDATVLVVLHDLNLAAAVCDRLGVVSAGRIVAFDRPAEVLTPGLVRDVFGIDVRVVAHPEGGAPQLLYDLFPAPERTPSR